MKERYMFFGIDDTLTDNATRKIVPSAQKTPDRLQEAGYFVAIAAGKVHYKTRGFMEASGLHSMICYGGNGLMINNGLIMNIPLDRQKVIAVYKEARAPGYGALVMLDDSIDVCGVDDRFLRQCGEWKEPTNYISHTDFDIDQVKDIYRLYISVLRGEKHRLTRKDTLGSLCLVETCPMFQHNRKKEGTLDMMERLGGPVEDVVVFRSDYDDLVTFDDA